MMAGVIPPIHSQLRCRLFLKGFALSSRHGEMRERNSGMGFDPFDSAAGDDPAESESARSGSVSKQKEPVLKKGRALVHTELETDKIVGRDAGGGLNPSLRFSLVETFHTSGAQHSAHRWCTPRPLP